MNPITDKFKNMNIVQILIFIYWCCIFYIVGYLVYLFFMVFIFNIYFSTNEIDGINKYTDTAWKLTKDIWGLLFKVGGLYFIFTTLLFLLCWLIYLIFDPIFIISWLPAVLIPIYTPLKEEGIYDLFNTLFGDSDNKLQVIMATSPFFDQEIEPFNPPSIWSDDTRDAINSFYNQHVPNIIITNEPPPEQPSKESKTTKIDWHQIHRKLKELLKNWNFLEDISTLSSDIETKIEENME
jgi:hypothetical protein